MEHEQQPQLEAEAKQAADEAPKVGKGQGQGKERQIQQESSGQEPEQEPQSKQAPSQQQQNELEHEPIQTHPLAGAHCYLPDCYHPNGFRVNKVEIVEETTTVRFSRPTSLADPAGPGQF